MSLIVAESCDLPNGNYPGGKWTEMITANPVTVDGRVAWRLGAADDQIVKVFPNQEDDVIIVGARVHMAHGPVGVNSALLTFREGETTAGTWHLSIFQAGSDGSLEVRRGNTTTLGITDPGVYPHQQWCYIEAKVTIHDTTGTVELRVNGDTVLNLTGIDTRNGGTDGLIDTVGIGERMGGGDFRDIYICNGLGSSLNDFLGPQTIQARLVDGAGDLTQWTPNTGSNFQAVDESDPDEDTTYVESDVAAERDSYTVADFDVPDAINAVQAYTIARSVDAPLDLATFIRRSSTNNDGSAETPSGTYASRAVSIWETDPIAAAAWTLANLNATQVGIVSS